MANSLRIAPSCTTRQLRLDRGSFSWRRPVTSGECVRQRDHADRNRAARSARTSGAVAEASGGDELHATNSAREHAVALELYPDGVASAVAALLI